MPKITGKKDPYAYYLGIDPGASGGLALISGDGGLVCEAMPETQRDVWVWIAAKSPTATCPTFACIEQVGGHIQGNNQPGSAMFKFGFSAGGLNMALTAAGIPFELVTPQRWQKALGIPSRKKTESKGQFKNRLKAFAQQLFPQEKVTLSTADAILIAEYTRRFREGTLR